MNAFKCVLEIWIVHQRVGTMICPDIWDVTVPSPVTFANNVWSTELLPQRCHEAS